MDTGFLEATEIGLDLDLKPSPDTGHAPGSIDLSPEARDTDLSPGIVDQGLRTVGHGLKISGHSPGNADYNLGTVNQSLEIGSSRGVSPQNALH